MCIRDSSQSLHHTVGIELQMIIPFDFFRYLKGRCHGNQFCGKITYPLHLSLWHFETEWDIATSMYALTASLYRVNFVNFGSVTPEKTGLFVNFLYEMAKKLADLVGYLGIYWTDVYDLFTI